LETRYVANLVAVNSRRAWGASQMSDRHRPATRQQLIDETALAARLQQNAYDRFEDAAAAYFGVNRTSMRCMDVLERAGQLSAGEIARQTGLTSGAVTALLDRLERAGYVRRLRDQVDRRRILVRLTELALQGADEIYGPFAAMMSEYDRYSDADLRLILRFLERGSDLLLEHADRVEGVRRARQGGRRRDPPRAHGAADSQ
jgi:DNA-binding MarR family transcriptional regulator